MQEKSNDPNFRGHQILTNLKTEKGWAKEALLERLKECNTKNQSLYMLSENAMSLGDLISLNPSDLGVTDEQLEKFQKQQ